MTTGAEILIAIDGSLESIGALKLGVDLAKARESAVLLLHVDPAAAADAYDEDPLREPSEARILELDPVLKEAAEYARSQSVATELKLVGGADAEAAVVDAIEGIAMSREVAYIVVGSRGRGPLSNAILGSVSSDLLKESGHPVVVVRDPHRP